MVNISEWFLYSTLRIVRNGLFCISGWFSDYTLAWFWVNPSPNLPPTSSGVVDGLFTKPLRASQTASAPFPTMSQTIVGPVKSSLRYDDAAVCPFFIFTELNAPAMPQRLFLIATIWSMQVWPTQAIMTECTDVPRRSNIIWWIQSKLFESHCTAYIALLSVVTSWREGSTWLIWIVRPMISWRRSPHKIINPALLFCNS